MYLDLKLNRNFNNIKDTSLRFFIKRKTFKEKKNYYKFSAKIEGVLPSTSKKDIQRSCFFDFGLKNGFSYNLSKDYFNFLNKKNSKTLFFFKNSKKLFFLNLKVLNQKYLENKIINNFLFFNLYNIRNLNNFNNNLYINYTFFSLDKRNLLLNNVFDIFLKVNLNKNKNKFKNLFLKSLKKKFEFKKFFVSNFFKRFFFSVNFLNFKKPFFFIEKKNNISEKKFISKSYFDLKKIIKKNYNNFFYYKNNMFIKFDRISFHSSKMIPFGVKKGRPESDFDEKDPKITSKEASIFKPNPMEVDPEGFALKFKKHSKISSFPFYYKSKIKRKKKLLPYFNKLCTILNKKNKSKKNTFFNLKRYVIGNKKKKYFFFDKKKYLLRHAKRLYKKAKLWNKFDKSYTQARVMARKNPYKKKPLYTFKNVNIDMPKKLYSFFVYRKFLSLLLKKNNKRKKNLFLNFKKSFKFLDGKKTFYDISFFHLYKFFYFKFFMGMLKGKPAVPYKFVFNGKDSIRMTGQRDFHIDVFFTKKEFFLTNYFSGVHSKLLNLFLNFSSTVKGKEKLEYINKVFFMDTYFKKLNFERSKKSFRLTSSLKKSNKKFYFKIKNLKKKFFLQKVKKKGYFFEKLKKIKQYKKNSENLLYHQSKLRFLAPFFSKNVTSSIFHGKDGKFFLGKDKHEVSSWVFSNFFNFSFLRLTMSHKSFVDAKTFGFKLINRFDKKSKTFKKFKFKRKSPLLLKRNKFNNKQSLKKNKNSKGFAKKNFKISKNKSSIKKGKTSFRSPLYKKLRFKRLNKYFYKKRFFFYNAFLKEYSLFSKVVRYKKFKLKKKSFFIKIKNKKKFLYKGRFFFIKFLRALKKRTNVKRKKKFLKNKQSLSKKKNAFFKNKRLKNAIYFDIKQRKFFVRRWAKRKFKYRKKFIKKNFFFSHVFHTTSDIYRRRFSYFIFRLDRRDKSKPFFGNFFRYNQNWFHNKLKSEASQKLKVFKRIIKFKKYKKGFSKNRVSKKILNQTFNFFINKLLKKPIFKNKKKNKYLNLFKYKKDLSSLKDKSEFVNKEKLKSILKSLKNKNDLKARKIFLKKLKKKFLNIYKVRKRSSKLKRLESIFLKPSRIFFKKHHFLHLTRKFLDLLLVLKRNFINYEKSNFKILNFEKVDFVFMIQHVLSFWLFFKSSFNKIVNRINYFHYKKGFVHFLFFRFYIFFFIFIKFFVFKILEYCLFYCFFNNFFFLNNMFFYERLYLLKKFCIVSFFINRFFCSLDYKLFYDLKKRFFFSKIKYTSNLEEFNYCKFNNDAELFLNKSFITDTTFFLNKAIYDNNFFFFKRNGIFTKKKKEVGYDTTIFTLNFFLNKLKTVNQFKTFYKTNSLLSKVKSSPLKLEKFEMFNENKNKSFLKKKFYFTKFIKKLI